MIESSRLSGRYAEEFAEGDAESRDTVKTSYFGSLRWGNANSQCAERFCQPRLLSPLPEGQAGFGAKEPGEGSARGIPDLCPVFNAALVVGSFS